MSMYVNLIYAKESGKDIMDFYPNLDVFVPQYYMERYKEFTWTMLWTSGSLEKWEDIDQEWQKIRPRITKEIDDICSDAKTVTRDMDVNIVIDFILHNPYIETAYFNLCEWLENDSQEI